MTLPTDSKREASARHGLDIQAITVRFGSAIAVLDVSLRVRPGEVVALLGPSGCGKSTLLRSVTGLQRVDAGSVRWDGHDLAPVPVHRRGFGLMFQDGQLFAHRDVAGNVGFGLRMARMPAEQVRARTAELLELVGLAGYEDRSVATLSGGEQQRVALARALAPRPRLLLLDEPLSSLDRALRERLAGELAAILRHERASALYVTHDHDEAFAVADRVAVMSAGRLLQVDSPTRLWAEPASRVVAEFLGYDVLPARAAGGTWSPPNPGTTGDHLVAVAPGCLEVVDRVQPAAPTPSAAGQARPTGDGDRTLTAAVVARRPRRGGGSVVDVRLAGADGAEGPTVSARDPAGRSWHAGDLVTLRVRPDGWVAVPAR